jgi:aminoglycoside N3'-acetyltransferase
MGVSQSSCHLMSLKTTTKSDLVQHFLDLGVSKGMDVTVHSKLLAFGLIDGGVDTVYNALRAVVGSNGTIVVPTYTFLDSDTVAYDPLVTPSANVGMLGEHVRLLPGAVRSLSPIHNHVAIGPKSGILCETSPKTSLGRGSDFEHLAREGFHLLLLGCEFSEGCTHAHHMEAMIGVPYREWIELPRLLVRPGRGEPERILVRYYGRKDRRWTESFEVLRDQLRRSGGLKEAIAHYGRSYLIALTAVETCADSLLTKDPYALVTLKSES